LIELVIKSERLLSDDKKCDELRILEMSLNKNDIMCKLIVLIV